MKKYMSAIVKTNIVCLALIASLYLIVSFILPKDLNLVLKDLNVALLDTKIKMMEQEEKLSGSDSVALLIFYCEGRILEVPQSDILSLKEGDDFLFKNDSIHQGVEEKYKITKYNKITILNSEKTPSTYRVLELMNVETTFKLQLRESNTEFIKDFPFGFLSLLAVIDCFSVIMFIVVFILAKRGDAKSQVLLGKLYYHGTFFRQDIDKAKEWLEKAAEQECSEAQYLLKQLCSGCDELEKDFNKSIAVYMFLFVTIASLLIGWFYLFFGSIVRLVSKLLIVGSSLNLDEIFPESVFIIGTLFLIGFVIVKYKIWVLQQKKGQAEIKSLKQSFSFQDELGVLLLTIFLAVMYFLMIPFMCPESLNPELLGKIFGWLLVIFFVRILTPLLLLISAFVTGKRGCSEGQYIVGKVYYGSKFVRKNPYKAKEWFTKAAEQGNAKAQVMLGILYYNGEGVEQDIDKAQKLWLKAKEQKDAIAENILNDVTFQLAENLEASGVETTPEILYVLGKRYYIEKDIDKAIGYFTKAAEQGYPDAQYMLGSIYSPNNKSIEWFTKAAEQGHLVSQYILGNYYYKEDIYKAEQWYLKAAEQGHAESQYMLGKIYSNIRYLDLIDNKKSLEWYEKAAEKGYAEAQYMCGSYYSFIWLVGNDEEWYKKAVKWYDKAAEQGHAEARNGLKEIRRN